MLVIIFKVLGSPGCLSWSGVGVPEHGSSGQMPEVHGNGMGICTAYYGAHVVRPSANMKRLKFGGQQRHP